MLIPGIFLGVLLGLITGFIPGLNLGLFFLAAYKYGLANNFLLYLFVTSAVTNALVSNVTLLTPVAVASDPIYLAPLNSLIKQGQGYQAVGHAFFAYASGLALVLIMGVCLIFSGHAQYLSSALDYIGLSAALAVLMWGVIIIQSENKVMAVIVLALVSLAGFITLDKFPTNSMFILSTAIFGCGLGSTVKQTHLPPQDQSDDTLCYWDITYFFTGIVGGWLIGLPTSALCAALKTEEDPDVYPHKYTIANTALAQGSSMGMSLILILTNSGARDTASTYIDYLKIVIDPLQAIAIILGLLILISLLCDNFDKLTNFYLRLLKLFNPRLIKTLIILFNMISVFIFTGIQGLPLIILGIALGKLIQSSNIPQGLSLSAISLIPIVSLF